MAKEYTSLKDFQEYMNATNKNSPNKVTYCGDNEHTSSVYKTTAICSNFKITNDNTIISVSFVQDSGKLFDIQIEEN